MLSKKQAVDTAMEPQSSESQIHFRCLAYLTFFFLLSYLLQNGT